MAESVYEFSATNIDGKAVSLADYRGRVLLIVNVASKCGLTPQYEGLEALHRELRDQDFAVVGFPCNQFGAQEPGRVEFSIAYGRNRDLYPSPAQAGRRSLAC